MTEHTASKTNPFQWYLGKRIALEGKEFRVEGVEIAGRELAFRAADTRSDEVRFLSLFDLLGLEARDACFG